MNGYAYIDFETSMNGRFYLVGKQIDEVFEQVILTQGLRGLAVNHESKVMEPEDFASEFCIECQANDLKIAAYSTAEKETFEQLTACSGIEYLNLRKAAKKWINQYMRSEFDDLEELGVTMKLLNHHRRQLRNSLFSVSRLLTEQQREGLHFPRFQNYGWRQTSTHFRTVICALEKKQQEYGRLAPGQKKAGTKALRHNLFDVQVLPRLHRVIDQCDRRIVENSTVLMN